MKRKYNTAAALQKAGMRAIAAFGEGRGAPGDGRREALFKERLHVPVCEACVLFSVVCGTGQGKSARYRGQPWAPFLI